jgi:acyl phosphate:glycerol-3-phosphate acyltransferase
MIDLAFMGIVAYIVGTFPSAFILRRLTSGSDIRDEGSGNVGARNLYEVTGQRWLAIAALVIDAAKGVVAIGIAALLFDDWFQAKAAAGVSVVIGHNFNVFLKWKGGRGLATALGVGLVMNPLFTATWGVMYLMGFFVFKRDVAVGSMTATLCLAVLAYSLPDLAIDVSTIVAYQSISEVRFFVVAMMAPIFLRFLGPVREILRTAENEAEEELSE